MKKPVGCFVGTSEGSLSRFIKIIFRSFELLSNIIVKFLSVFLRREFVVKVFLKRCFSEKIQEIPVVKSTQESYFGPLAEAFFICLVGYLIKKEVHLGYVVAQADISPFCSLAG